MPINHFLPQTERRIVRVVIVPVLILDDLGLQSLFVGV